MFNADSYKVELGKQARTQLVFHAEETPPEFIWNDKIWVSFTPSQMPFLLESVRRHSELCNQFGEQVVLHGIAELLAAAQKAWTVEDQIRKEKKQDEISPTDC